jgi:signal transduction histidine kinase
MVLEVVDTGVGSASASTAGTGVGLSNLRARLAAAYEGAARVQAGLNPVGGYTVTLSLPR